MGPNLVKPKNSELKNSETTEACSRQMALRNKNSTNKNYFISFFVGFESTLLARQLQQERTQVEAQ